MSDDRARVVAIAQKIVRSGDVLSVGNAELRLLAKHVLATCSAVGNERLHVHGQQIGQCVHVVVRADDMPGAIAEFDTTIDGFTRLAAALDQQRASVWLTHVDPSEVFTKR